MDLEVVKKRLFEVENSIGNLLEEIPPMAKKMRPDIVTKVESIIEEITDIQRSLY